MYTLLLKTMTKSQTSKNTQSAKQIVRQISGITSRRSVPSISGTRKAREEFDPTKEHDEMLTRLSEIKALKDELEHEEKGLKSKLRKDLLSYQEDGDVPEFIIHKMKSFMQDSELLLLTSIVRSYKHA